MLHEQDLHGYQTEAVDWILEKSHCALFLEMGLGKTVSTLTAINKLIYHELEIDSVLVVAPKRVASSVWDAECKKWAHLRHLKITKIQGTAKQRRQALQENADIYTIGRDNIAWLCGQFGGTMLPYGMLVIDESSSFKNPKAVRFKALRGVQPSFQRVVELTGTPAPNGLIDLWGPMYLLDRGQRLGKFVTHYREDYFRPGTRNGAVIYKYDLQTNAEERIYNKIGDICMSMKAKDYLDMPDIIENNVMVEFSDELKKKYKDFEKEKVLELLESVSPDDSMDPDKVVSATNGAALANKLQQFANGAVYDASKNAHGVHDLKIEALQEIVEDAAGKSVLIAYTFIHDLDRIMLALKKYKPVKLNSDQDIEDWNDGKIQVMVMHPASGGHGLNIQNGGNIIVWFGQTWSLELLQQFNARLYRQGQKFSVIINKLIAKGTIDERIIASQKNKDSKQDGLMSAVKAIIKLYT